MSNLLDQAVDYANENPGIIAGACLAVLIIAVTQIVLTTSPSTSVPGVLSQDYMGYPLISKTTVSHNTRIFRFGLPSENSRLGLPVGRHVSVCARIDGVDVRRPYTPISSDSTLGFFELLIKVYPEPYGTMSRYMDGMEIGDRIDVRGPLGKFGYSRNMCRHLKMVCGGTGITPMWQVLRAVLDDDRDNTKISLVFANVGVEDILLKEELDELANENEKLDVYYVLNEPPEGWSGGVGFVSKEILDRRFGKAEMEDMVLMCGPPMMNKAMKGILMEMGYKEKQMFKF